MILSYLEYLTDMFPIKKRTVTIRPAAPWYSEELRGPAPKKRPMISG